MTLLIGVVFFFLLTKAELWHHGHEHNHEHVYHDHDEAHAHSHDHAHAHGHQHGTKSSGWSLLTGDSVHCFGDGILIASAFVADIRLGLIAAVSVLAHEVPHHIGDLVVLRNSKHRNLALLKVSLAGAVTALGGICGYFLVGHLEESLPVFFGGGIEQLCVCGAVRFDSPAANACLPKESLVQVAWLVTGIVLVTLVSGLAHGGHGH